MHTTGVLTCPGIFPTSFTILWRRQSTLAAIVSPLLGMATGLAVWLGSAKSLYGSVTVVTTGQILPCVYGTVASAFSPLPYTILISLLGRREDYDWADFRKEKLAFGPAEGEDNTNGVLSANDTDDVIKQELNASPAEPGSQPCLRRWFKIAVYWSIATFLGHWVLWPLPMYASKYLFSKTFFNAWLVVAITWLWCTLLIAGFFPLIGGRRQFKAIWQAVKHRSHEGELVSGGNGSASSPKTKQSSNEDVINSGVEIETKH